jgi:hypothetical protein
MCSSQGCMQSPVGRNSPGLNRLTSTPLREFNGLDKAPSRDGSFDATDNGLVNRGMHPTLRPKTQIKTNKFTNP